MANEEAMVAIEATTSAKGEVAAAKEVSANGCCWRKLGHCEPRPHSEMNYLIPSNVQSSTDYIGR